MIKSITEKLLELIQLSLKMIKHIYFWLNKNRHWLGQMNGIYEGEEFKIIQIIIINLVVISTSYICI